MEENLSNEEEKFQKVENLEKKPKGKFIIKYIIFVLILAILTAVAIYFTIQYRNKINNNEEVKKDVFATEKKETDEKNLVISSYAETYNENPIRITEYYDDNGKLYTEFHNYDVQFIQISGLQDKEMESKINYRLKEEAYALKQDNGGVMTQVMGNFSNILSVVISSHHQKNGQYFYNNKAINIDLNTGEDIPFEKVFISSAPIKALLVDGLNEQLAWNAKRLDADPDMPFEDYNMDNVDTSEYEEKALLLAKKYENKKDNLEFSISPREVIIYNFLDKDILEGYDDSNVWNSTISIDLAKNKNEVAIYKRYLGENIYADKSIGMKNIVVFTEGYLDDFMSINYGKVKDNIFLEEAVYCYDKIDYNYAKTFIEKKSQELQESIKNEITENEGMICQRFYDVAIYGTSEYISISVRTHKAICSKEYFKEGAFKDYIRVKAMPRADIGINSFSEYFQDEYPNLRIKEEEQETYYLDKSGNIVATSWEEMRTLVNN